MWSMQRCPGPPRSNLNRRVSCNPDRSGCPTPAHGNLRGGRGGMCVCAVHRRGSAPHRRLRAEHLSSGRGRSGFAQPERTPLDPTSVFPPASPCAELESSTAVRSDPCTALPPSARRTISACTVCRLPPEPDTAMVLCSQEKGEVEHPLFTPGVMQKPVKTRWGTVSLVAPAPSSFSFPLKLDSYPVGSPFELQAVTGRKVHVDQARAVGKVLCGAHRLNWRILLAANCG